MSLVAAKIPTRRAFAERMTQRGETDKEFVVFESDLAKSTYSFLFKDKHPERYFNMGIAEIGTVAAAAGMAAQGRNVVVCGYGVFITMRAVEAIRSFICYPHLNVKFLSSHGGLTAAIDGVTHQSTEDIAFMTTLPQMKVLVPADTTAATAAFDIALETPGPVFTRLMRDPMFDLYKPDEVFALGGSKIVRKGKDVTIATYGDMVFQSLVAADELAKRGIDAEVIDFYSLKPWDQATLHESLKKTRALVVAENHQKRNGFGYEAAVWTLLNCPVPTELIGLEDTFAESGAYQKTLEKFGLSGAAIAEKAAALVSCKI
ncbi:transketolase family protein [Propionivibrio dicarboxylicus]|uniref:Transketolase n=1 Tax=Propionivibrio dicarboxylicus TaxID=83767 RepID=A0A1G8H869_9RHOO|nr:transketolase C-terminal domain-containing protein [Propionivibrio dicarboxylicus]SDI02759.1 transketolase [Propionivibrio dicarboxylicus]